MAHAIIGFGSIGQAFARAFARKGLEVQVAGRRAPGELAPQAQAIGATIKPVTLTEALEVDVIFLAVPFAQHAEVAKARASWRGKLVVDVTNASGVPVESLDDLTSSAWVARGLPGATLVKGFNHLAAKVLDAGPDVNGGRRVVFLAGDDAGAAEPIRALAEQLGFAPVWLGGLAGGGALVQARDRSWAPLIFQDLVKFPS